jgi:hypothetical protein
MSYLGTHRGRARLSLEPVSGVQHLSIPGLIAYWPMEVSSTTVYDASGNDLNGTSSGSPTFSAANGVRGAGCLFDTAGQKITVDPDALINNLDAFSLSCWVYLDSFGTAGRIFDKDGKIYFFCSSLADQPLIGRYSVNAFAFFINYSTTEYRYYSADNSATTTGWNHLVFIRPVNNDVSLYINGVSDTPKFTQAAVGTQNDDSGGALVIGNRAASDRTFDGSIDEFRLFNRALNHTEALALWDYDRAGAGL